MWDVITCFAIGKFSLWIKIYKLRLQNKKIILILCGFQCKILLVKHVFVSSNGCTYCSFNVKEKKKKKEKEIGTT